MSWIFSKAPEADPAPLPEGEETANSPLSDPKPELDKDELRRLRLANFAGAGGSASPSDAPLAKRERLETGTERKASSPTLSSVASTPTASAVREPLKEQREPPAKPAAGNSPMKSPLKASVRTLTFALEQIFQFSLRAECELPIQFLDLGGEDPSGNFDSSRVSELVCMHIASMENGSAILYLLACYRRLCQKEQTAADAQKPELISCRKQIVCFIVSCLTDPDIFGSESANSVLDFIRHIGSDFNTSFGIGMLKFVADELEAQDALLSVRSIVYFYFVI